MSKKEQDEQVPPKGIYLLPNLFTTGSLFAGFYAIVAAMKGLFDTAAIAIFVAMILDALDGRVARLTNTQSEFGAEYDSLSDMVAFGVAPALVVYSYATMHLGKLGWLAAFLYTAGVGLRLARFNSQLGSMDKRYFIGLPCPSAAAMIAGTIWIAHMYELTGTYIDIAFAVMSLALGVLMVSNVRYLSFKDVDFKKHVGFGVVIVIVLAYVAISISPAQVLLGIFVIYVLSGPLMALWRLRKPNRKKTVEKSSDKAK
ncbi:CDP-diacylglycerol--serine O-phosphatidyltransferase [Piscirickettsia litoralis]|uniref:CDP-diacylglycerol--serine O-phosphatidyltransferase n=1 Tax=Piscirickettsia litoralis TaxID=1891921 RepID=A0ABX3A303_9GAMM|nr:CDP-diacylglycerol--serine O-phosphatidyltransferase [Piscirickettsia litoralis]ODN43257.1 CDP-diacylglycerol--serine O-phosphatidyltransferase [Piscirickettsia litoralis]